MKNKYQIIIIAVVCSLLSFTWTSCEKIDNPYETHIINVEGNRKVLLEDYTAIRCVNCPAAAHLAHQIDSIFNHKVIVLSIHGGMLAAPMPSDSLLNFDLRTPEGREYYDFYHIEAQPIGLIDKLKDSDNNSYPTLPITQWQSTISNRLLLRSPVEFSSLESKIIEGNLNARIHYKAVDNLSENHTYKLLLYLVEDSVITGQKNSNPAYGTVPIIKHYVHHNVLRGTVNGTWGTVIDKPTLEETSSLFTNYQIPNYDVSAIYKIIAIIYDEYEVLQAEEFLIQ